MNNAMNRRAEVGASLTRLRLRLPEEFLPKMDEGAVAAVGAGMSEAFVWRISGGGEPRYLKIAEGAGAAALRREIERTAWLAARGVRVAEILRTHVEGGVVALLTRAVQGAPAEEAPLAKEALMAALGQGLARLHALPAQDCPFDERAGKRLARAWRAIAAGQVDTAEFADRNRGLAPAALWQRLSAAIPAEDLVVAHGDATLSNMIVGQDGSVGFVDCGHCGVADRYLDLAVAGQDIADAFGSAELAAFAAAYGETRWNAAKAGFFADLYELF
jgi:aminoglycoside phosphotransferase